MGDPWAQIMFTLVFTPHLKKGQIEPDPSQIFIISPKLSGNIVGGVGTLGKIKDIKTTYENCPPSSSSASTVRTPLPWRLAAGSPVSATVSLPAASSARMHA